MAARRKNPRLRVGDPVTGRTYVEPEDRGRESPKPITGTVSQIGSGWDGVDEGLAYVWVRLPSGREAKALAQELEPAPSAGAGAPRHLPRRP
ncbi:hypothetical protein OHS33_39470 (plasmid) [Streptomyces sp. NBC_00536]|uniref:hypothetical protein n=1 Tax=Streptomyces sp. NBC_00536 TaxID=2975769 RepID=UPI002E81B1E5|nr:hypothetical protein [Streptomyces sp. NBC_00536]WUC84536.1 hypothetical protein OHS33_39470 [Streptomyces sp. NBC_00536]